MHSTGRTLGTRRPPRPRCRPFMPCGVCHRLISCSNVTAESSQWNLDSAPWGNGGLKYALLARQTEVDWSINTSTSTDYVQNLAKLNHQHFNVSFVLKLD